MKSNLAYVWPLIDGLPGSNALGEPMTLKARVRGLMDLEAARRHESQGNLVLMAGKSPSELYKLKRKPGTYQVSAMASEPKTEVEEEPPTPPKRRGRPPGKASQRYKRRDMTAEDPK